VFAMVDRLLLNAQLAVDELFEEKRIHLKLTVKGVEALGSDFANYYKVRFFDIWLPQITVFWQPGESFKRVVREAVEREIRGED
jgi:hypothetical protein